MDASKDYYAVLGVLPSIEPAAIRAVYLALLKKYHPDVYKGTKEEAVRRTKEFNEAYDVLGDEKISHAEGERLGNRFSVGFASRQQSLDLVLDRSA